MAIKGGEEKNKTPTEAFGTEGNLKLIKKDNQQVQPHQRWTEPVTGESQPHQEATSRDG